MKAHTQFPLKCRFCDFISNTKEDMHSHIYKGHNKLTLWNRVQILPEVAYKDGNGALYCTCGGQFPKARGHVATSNSMPKKIIPFEGAQMLHSNKDPIAEANNFNY